MIEGKDCIKAGLKGSFSTWGNLEYYYYTQRQLSTGSVLEDLWCVNTQRRQSINPPV